MTFPYDIKVNRCSGNCNNITNPYAKVCVQVIFHESCKCICRLDPIVCNNKQRWNKNKCRCECLINKKCTDDVVWSINSCECEYKKAAKLTTEGCEEIIDDTTTTTQNKTIVIKEFGKKL